MSNWWETDPCRVCGKKDCGMMIKGLCLLCVDVAIDYCDKHNSKYSGLPTRESSE